MTSLEEYLNINVTARKTFWQQTEPMSEYQYCCMEELVLKEGMFFKGSPLPKKFKKMPNKACYQNALELMIREDNLIYCEGYATSVIPVAHAWCIDREGNVVDPTWKDPQDCEYYGIPFKRDFALRTVYKNGVYGIIDDWKNHWPLCKSFDPKTIKEEIHAKAYAR